MSIYTSLNFSVTDLINDKKYEYVANFYKPKELKFSNKQLEEEQKFILLIKSRQNLATDWYNYTRFVMRNALRNRFLEFSITEMALKDLFKAKIDPNNREFAITLRRYVCY